jgi:Family of unknown function (DUF5677)
MSDDMDPRSIELMTIIESTFNCVKERMAKANLEGSVMIDALGRLASRIENTWRTIFALCRHGGDHRWEIDAATLLRASFEAYLQIAYILSNRDDAERRAQDYLDFAHIDRWRGHKLLQKMNNQTAQLIIEIGGVEGEERLERNYDNHKSTFLNKNCKIRDKWYPGSLYDLSEEVDCKDEYRFFVSHYNGAVHSSALSIAQPLIDRDHVYVHTTFICARMLRLIVRYFDITLDDGIRKYLDKLCIDDLLSNPTGP